MYLVAGHYAHPLKLEWGRLGALLLGGTFITVGVMQTSHIGIKVALFVLFLIWVGTIVFRRRSAAVVAQRCPEGSGPGV